MKKIGLIAGLSFVFGTIFFALFFSYFQRSSDSNLDKTPFFITTETNRAAGSPFIGKIFPGPDFVSLVRKVKPAVVKVKSESVADRRRFFEDEFLENFFTPLRKGDREKVSSIGSGFFISPDGFILTNNHLVAKSMKIIITDIDGNEFPAKKIGSDPKTDLALLKIDIDNHSYLELGDSDSVGIGEWVLAIGNPLGQDLSVTSGIVSAKGRQLVDLEVDYQDFIQTDAPINQGNSGGPLINMAGEAVGINSVILSTGGGSIGLGFAIPSNMAQKVLGALKKGGRVIRGYIGVQIAEVSDSEAGQYDFPMGGVLIVRVEDGGPAQKAGLKKYDLIIDVDGKKVKTTMDLRNIIAGHNPGETAKLTIYREKIKKIVYIKVIEGAA